MKKSNLIYLLLNDSYYQVHMKWFHWHALFTVPLGLNGCSLERFIVPRSNSHEMVSLTCPIHSTSWLAWRTFLQILHRKPSCWWYPEGYLCWWWFPGISVPIALFQDLLRRHQKKKIWLEADPVEQYCCV